MNVVIDNKIYNIVVSKKTGNKNTYIRVKEDLKIYVTTNYLVTDKYIIKLINDNTDSIKKMINKIKIKEARKNDFYYLGQKYEIVYIDNKDIIVGSGKIFINRRFDLNKWLRKEAKTIFLIEFDSIYNSFIYDIPYPTLYIRSMKTRWGVCNTKECKVTLNFELIKRNKECLRYVIVHELCHLLYPNHSKKFWECVESIYPNYKEIRKELKDNG